MGDESRPINEPTRVTSGDVPPPSPVRWAIGTHVGKYEILGSIGRGGMGAVYRARQSNPSREVAIKVIRPDMLSQRSWRRFEQEAEALGRLQHPGIAQIHEAGVHDAETGRMPFFAMELVHGTPLVEFARTRNLSTDERLEMMARVCDAVQHAHTKGVIHRDLKPDNILVTDSGDPKVMDFGIARVTDSDVRSATMETHVGQIVGTVPFMSPEQVSGDPSQIDTQSDVYSLGVVMFELLAGRLPMEFEGKTIAEAVRMIQQDEPLSLASIDRTFRGDVDTVVRTALEKDRGRRYASASAMASDIRAAMSHRPIAARPPSTTYQLRKFARRNKVLVGSGVVLVLVLIAATVVSTVFAVGQARALERATKSLRNMRAINTFFLDDIIGAMDRDVSQGRDLTVREMLDVASRNADLIDEAEVEALVRTQIGVMYRDLFQLEEARPHFERAMEIAETSEDLSDDTEDLLWLESSEFLAEIGNASAADNAMNRVLESRLRRYGAVSPELASAHVDWANRLFESEQGDEAQVHLERAMTIFQALPKEARVSSAYAEAIGMSGHVAMLNGEFDSALDAHQRSLSIRVEIFGPSHTEVARSHFRLAQTKWRMARFEEALEEASRALAIRTLRLPPSTAPIAQCRTLLGRISNDAGRYEEAAEHNAAAVQVYDAVYEGTLSYFPAWARLSFAESLAGLGRTRAAEEEFETAISALDRLHRDGVPGTGALVARARERRNAALSDD